MTSYETTHVKEIYDKIAHEFDNTRTYKWTWIDQFVSTLENDSIVCDIGCGNGRNMKYNNLQFIGVDNCKKFVDMCNIKGLNAIESDMTNIKLESESVDHILCIASFHHLYTKENRLKSLHEMKRILKGPSSKILLSVWSIVQPKKTRVVFDNYGDTMVSWKNTHDRYYYIFKLDELESLFKEAGLYIESHSYDCGNEIYVLHTENTILK